ncbi:MAG TPA: hypothetical protein VGJ94_03460 [Syntrophorhabdaceae bacterium]
MWTRTAIAAGSLALFLLVAGDFLYAQRRGGGGSMQQQGRGRTEYREPTLPLDFDDRPFEMDQARLPTFYVGYEPGRLYDRLKSRKSDPTLVYAIRFNSADTRYDPSDELLHVRCRLSGVLASRKETDALKGLSVKYTPLIDNRYSGTDASGARVEMEEIKFQEYLLAFRNFNEYPVEKAGSSTAGRVLPGRVAELPWSGADDRMPRDAISGTIRFTPKEAKQMADRVAVLLVFRPEAPYGGSESMEERPGRGTYRHLFAQYYYIYARLLEVWLYDFDTGKIFEKMKPRKSVRFPQSSP